MKTMIMMKKIAKKKMIKKLKKMIMKAKIVKKKKIKLRKKKRYQL